MKLDFAVKSLHGNTSRGANDDRVLARADLGLLVVADASGPTYGGYHEPLGVDVGLRAIADVVAAESTSARRTLQGAFEEANREMLQVDTRIAASQPNGVPAHSAASITAMLVRSGVVTIAQVGACRAYLVRDGSLRLLVPDHTLGTVHRRTGEYQEIPVTAYPDRFVVTKMLGFPEVSIDFGEVGALSGDILLLCSDGLWAEVQPADICSALTRDVPCADLVDGLTRIPRAEQRDDLSVLVVKITV